MKKIYNNISILLLFALFGLSSSVSGHSVQVGYCVSCDGLLRIYVEHWHGETVGATTMDIELNIGGVITTVTGEPKGFISDTVKSDLPDCATPITVFGECPPAASIPAIPGFPAVAGQCGANTCNYWVVYDFPTVTKGVPITITILSGNNQFTEDGCSMFPASPPVFVIPPDVTPTIIELEQTVCPGNSTTVGVDLGSLVGNLQWQSSATSGGPWQDIIGSTITPLSTGPVTETTYYQAVLTGDCGTLVSDESVVIVAGSTPPSGGGAVGPAGADITSCPTSTPGNLGAIPVAGNTYSWSPATGLNSATVANPTVDLSAVVNRTYTLTTTGPSGCSSTTDEVNVVVSNDLAVSVNSPDLCFGETATITASGATSYSWSPATDLNTTTGATVICSAPGSTTYTVTGTSNGCVGTAVSVVTMNPTPSSNAGADISICSGTTGTIGAPSTPGYIYSWTPATNLSSATAANPTVSPTNFSPSPITLTYVVTTSPAGCFSKDTVDVIVNPALDPTFSYSSSTFCQTGGGANPSPTITAAGGVFTASPVGLSFDGSSGLVDLALSTLGTYTVTYTHSGPCPSSSSAVITITNIPDAQFSYGAYCQNETNPLPAFPAGASAGIFSSAPGLVFVSTASGEVNLAASTPGTYTVTNTIAAGGGCPSAVITNTITINAIPVTTMDTPIICNGEVAMITAGGADSYVWSDNSTGATLSVSPTTGTNYTVTGTSAGCSSDAVGAVVVNPIPPIGVNNATVCAGVAANLIATGATTYSWSGGGPASATYSPSPLSTISYTVTGTSQGCSGTAVSNVTVIDLPVVAVNSAPVCAGSSVTLVASGATTYVWTDDNSTLNTRSVSPATTTQYTVTGTSAGCSATAMADVTVNPVPTSPFTVTPACVDLGSTITYTGNSPANAIYTWDFDGGTVLSGSGQGPYSVSWSAAGTPNVTLSVSIGTCVSPLTTMPVTISPLPTVLVNPTTICSGDAGILIASGASTYTWSNGLAGSSLTVSPTVQTTYTVTGASSQGCVGTASATIDVNPLPPVGTITDTICAGFNATITATGATNYFWSNGASGNTTTVSPTRTTTYSVTGTDVNGCSSPATARVEVVRIPVAQFSSSPGTTGYYEPTITFNNQSSNDVTSWYWEFGDGDTLDNNSPNPIHTYPSDTATYTAFLKVGNTGNCFDSITHLVVIGPEYTMYIPNAFSPNGDGKNEVFMVKADGFSEFEMMIYDRWGNFIFYSTDINSGWNGDYMGNSSQEDVYVYSIIVIDHSGKEYTYRGTVTLVR